MTNSIIAQKHDKWEGREFHLSNNKYRLQRGTEEISNPWEDNPYTIIYQQKGTKPQTLHAREHPGTPYFASNKNYGGLIPSGVT